MWVLIKKLKTPFLLCVVGVMAFFLWSAKEKNQHLKQLVEAAPFEKEITPNKQIKKYFTRDSVLHVVYKDRIINRDRITSNGVTELVDSVAKVLDIKAKHIQEIAQVNARLQGEVKALRIERDSLAKRTFFFETRFLQAQFAEGDSTLKYQYDAQLNMVKHNKPTGFLNLGPKETVIDISSPDPQFATNGFRQMQFKTTERRKPFGLGLIGGYGVMLPTGRLGWFVGGGASYDVARL